MRTEERITLPEAARRLGVSHATLFRWVQQGLVHAERVGRTHVVSGAEIERLRGRVLPRPLRCRLLPPDLAERSKGRGRG